MNYHWMVPDQIGIFIMIRNRRRLEPQDKV